MLRHILVAVLLVLALTGTLRAEVLHQPWDELLQRHVRVLDGGRATQVDYKGIAVDRPQLVRYLESMEKVGREDFDKWPTDRQLAFLINAYNGWTVQLILGRYPDLKSIKDLGSVFRSPWKQVFIPLLGEQRSLDDIEHGLIRGSGRYNEPRIHFVVNCASVGCPALPNRAFVEDQLDRQLEEATKLFLADRSRNRLRGSTLEVSSIFKWYREDFERGWRGATNLGDFLTLYKDSLGLNGKAVDGLRSRAIDIDFLDYDWRLNDVK
jgi:Protein of unknown function, DUF547